MTSSGNMNFELCHFCSRVAFDSLGDRDDEILKSLKLDIDSWHGAQKKEVELKLKECSDFLQAHDISSPDDIMVPFIKQYQDKIISLEEQAFLERKIMESTMINDAIEKNNEYMKKNLDYNNELLQAKKVSNLKTDLEFLSLDTSDEIDLPVRELPELNFERINKLLDVIEEQEREIKALKAKKNELL